MKKKKNKHQKLTIPIVDKNVEQPERSVTAGGCVNWCKHCGAVYCLGIVTKTEHTNTYHVAIPLVTLHPRERHT